VLTSVCLASVCSVKMTCFAFIGLLHVCMPCSAALSHRPMSRNCHAHVFAPVLLQQHTDQPVW
jgi:hypothetical protein